jgi:hypothetical protein
LKNNLLLLVGLLVGVALLGSIGYVSSTSASASVSTPYETNPQSLSSEQIVYDSQSTGIWVSGQGTVTAVPDMAILSIGVEAEAATVDEAMDEAAVAMDRVIASLHANGVAENDIKTQWFDIYPINEWVDVDYSVKSWIEDGYEILVGYQVTNMVTVKIRNVEATGQVIDAAAKAGGDLIRINGVSFTVDDPSIYEGEARAQAIADARAKAQQLASLAGVHLGSPFYISESGGFYPIYQDYYGMGVMEAARVPTSISPGETEITLTVQMAFAIQ